MSERDQESARRTPRRVRFRALVALTVTLVVLGVAAAPFCGAASGVLGLAAVVVAVLAWGHARPDDSRALRLGIAAFVAALVVGLVAAGSQGAGVPVLGGEGASGLATVGSPDGIATPGAAMADDVSATVGTYRAATEHKQGGLPVTVTNVGDDAHSVTVELVARDAAGTEVARTSIAVDSLASGGMRTVTAFGQATGDVAAALETATFDVVAITGA